MGAIDMAYYQLGLQAIGNTLALVNPPLLCPLPLEFTFDHDYVVMLRACHLESLIKPTLSRI